jgi:hypothetical protein
MAKLVGVNERGLRVGEDHQRAKHSDREVDQMRELHEEHGACYSDLADWFECPKSTVQKYCQYLRRTQWPVGYRLLKKQ